MAQHEANYNIISKSVCRHGRLKQQTNWLNSNCFFSQNRCERGQRKKKVIKKKQKKNRCTVEVFKNRTHDRQGVFFVEHKFIYTAFILIYNLCVFNLCITQHLDYENTNETLPPNLNKHLKASIIKTVTHTQRMQMNDCTRRWEYFFKALFSNINHRFVNLLAVI